ncbi:MAG TPA: heme ABC transporter permease [Alphaproteobacteria bacterium]|jgi:heme exporter protein C|nr:heme ABC transporter permease [Alphaproteobacteria bacterium]MDP6269175.1 heme ABC transporter permease [Alphaproteobacteria bacterium]MDP7164780.1 heme ABC transporter permease [Alphaproteobacteria bacterium]MDP7428269.1 heme ABC transporter permease [Alphaproteobacteria bacterium]HJM50996.1 heme ABC transporter permease [Alphaproteobacteria bacterium]|tara:strand:- start:260 stop:994 length:735 start_codon:yes stop_codon:yes gene_type:complete
MFQRFANPNRFVRLTGAILPWSTGLAALLIAVGLYLGLFVAPPDYQQGDSVRIMFVHVPAAWMALFVYTTMAGASAVGLIWKHPVADLTAKASAPVGAAFTFIALVSGSLWGQPMWGTWWVWDARLTSVLVLFFLYLGYMALWQAFEDPERAGKAAAILALVGFVNVPIIKFSVDWWNTLHQPASVMRADGPAIHPSILVPLLLMSLGFTFFYLSIVIVRTQREIMARKIRSLRLLQVERESAG